ncbi:MAG: DUF4079 domain-containing protein [Deltaproteobacteria bacterium HGW-Deltaproteobacteria-18]|jgi:uncharacterized membrane protein YozB (DUF420 family)|nr:MAG: DUF4079 domain-containing protein [Deltaproteobacteria bacterium HGW-Deltaproteobacteria-18]PKN48204.1 MAG: DUF4079 domain-containing protein [Deltaproteobacteria bacterium HGW-Deltaproteobacteria-20]
MLWIHPLLQLVATGLALYVLSLGWPRFQANHLGKKGKFMWAEHVRFGKYAHILWMSGLVLGLYAVAQHWGQNTITGNHYWIGQLMMPCIAGGYITGVIMDRNRKKRRYLPLAHAVFNTLAVLLALAEVVTGIGVIRLFLMS